MKSQVSALVLLVGLAACGSPSSAQEDPSRPDASVNARYFPIAVGAVWNYRVTGNGSAGLKTQEVLAFEDVGDAKSGIMAFKLETTKPSGNLTLSWQEDTGSALIRHKEQTFAADLSQETEEFYLPSKLRLDESVASTELGASFVFDYDEEIEDFRIGGGPVRSSKSETWTIEAVDIEITVPAGSFRCIQVRKFNSATGSDKQYWFARGVGKIKEQNSLQAEELTSYSLP